MYEIIAAHTFIVLSGILSLILLHDLAWVATGFVFEEDYAHKIVANWPHTDTHTAINMFFGNLAAVFLAGIVAMVWPLSIVILSVSAILLLLRKAVRASKSALAKHVEDLHKEK